MKLYLVADAEGNPLPGSKNAYVKPGTARQVASSKNNIWDRVKGKSNPPYYIFPRKPEQYPLKAMVLEGELKEIDL